MTTIEHNIKGVKVELMANNEVRIRVKYPDARTARVSFDETIKAFKAAEKGEGVVRIRFE